MRKTFPQVAVGRRLELHFSADTLLQVRSIAVCMPMVRHQLRYKLICSTKGTALWSTCQLASSRMTRVEGESVAATRGLHEVIGVGSITLSRWGSLAVTRKRVLIHSGRSEREKMIRTHIDAHVHIL